MPVGWVLNSTDPDDNCAHGVAIDYYADTTGGGLGAGAPTAFRSTEVPLGQGWVANERESQPHCPTNNEMRYYADSDGAGEAATRTSRPAPLNWPTATHSTHCAALPRRC